MKPARIEPGLLAIFRLFLVFQLFLIVVNIHVHSSHALIWERPEIPMIFSAACVAILVGYLSWPWLRKKMGRSYLPVGLVAAASFSLAAHHLFLAIPLSSNLHPGGSAEATWQIFVFLFIPVILASWQYGFGFVIGYCLFTSLVDFVLVSTADPNYPAIAETYRRLLFIRFFSFAMAGYVISRIMKQLHREQQALREAKAEIEASVATLEQLTISRERVRVAQELHDTVAHTLSGLAVQLEAVDTVWENDQQGARQMLKRSLSATRHGLTETRRAIQSLRASPLEDLGLVRAICRSAEAAAERAGFRLVFDQPVDIEGLPQEIEQCFYRVAVEAIENVSRHAQARSMTVSLSRDAQELRMEIDDDGIGFDPEALGEGHHYGVLGMRERSERIGAGLAISSRAGEGTRIRLTWSGKAGPRDAPGGEM
jgi:signal transduction histidine kinase